jgi:single-strand DNA-binding protein
MIAAVPGRGKGQHFTPVAGLTPGAMRRNFDGPQLVRAAPDPNTGVAVYHTVEAREAHHMSLNKTMIIGNLGRDPESRSTGSGMAVLEFSVAVNGRRKSTTDPSGWEDETEWFAVKAFDKLAERAANWLRKGRKVYVEGKMQTHSWDDKEHPGTKRYKTELIAAVITPLDAARRESDNGGSSDEAPAAARGRAAGAADDEIPF